MRSGEERSEELTKLAFGTEAARAPTFVQDKPPPQSRQSFSSFILSPSNFSPSYRSAHRRKQVDRIVRMFDKEGVKLDVVTGVMSIVDQGALRDGTLDACKRNGVTFMAEEPMGKEGIGSGRYTARDPTGGEMGKPKFEFKVLEPLLGVHDGLRTVGGMVRRRLKEEWEEDRERRKGKGEKIDINEGEERAEERHPQPPLSLTVLLATAYGVDISTSQVACKWVEAKGAVPLVTVTAAKEATEITGGKEWRLRGDEMEVIEEQAKKAGLE